MLIARIDFSKAAKNSRIVKMYPVDNLSTQGTKKDYTIH